MKKQYSLIASILLSILLSACHGGTQLPPASACNTTADDSQGSGSGITSLINSIDGNATFHTVVSPRKSQLDQIVTLKYIVHNHASPKALLMLIAGGQLDAGLAGTDGGLATASGGNFLARSAHLFAQQGYKVVTIDQPDDSADYINGNTRGWALDEYRISLAHAVDLSAIINDANTTHLPVVIAGTSRGAISAVAHADLASAIALSNPVTGGSSGRPVKHSNAAVVSVPAHILWHEQDACTVTVPVDSYTLAGAFPYGSDSGVKGGFTPTGENPCGAYSYHGFLGIESCAVSTSSHWLDGIVASLSINSPITSPIDQTVPAGTTDIDLGPSVSAADGGALHFSLPFTSLLHGGSASLNGSTLRYKQSSTGVVETLVYVVREEGGGRSHNTIKFTVN